MFEDLKGLILVIKYTLNPSNNAHPSLSMGCKGSSSNGMTMCIECKVIIHFTTGLLKIQQLFLVFTSEFKKNPYGMWRCVIIRELNL